MSNKNIAVHDGTYDSTGTKLNSTPDGKIDYYTADVVTANDFYPFGMVMPGRKFSSQNDYRYGFSGKENDKEIKGFGNSMDFGERMLDTRLGKWLSLDPLQKKYPDLSPYNYCINNPIYLKDMKGKDVYVFDKDKNIVAVLRTNYKDIAIQINYKLSTGIVPVVQKTTNILYSQHKSYDDAFVIGIAGSVGYKASVVMGAEIVLFTRGKDAGQPFVYSYVGGNLGYTKGSNITLTLSALNYYKPYSMIDDMRDKRVRSTDDDLRKESYNGKFFETQAGVHNTIYGTDNNWFAPVGNINWFGEGITIGSVGLNSSMTDYTLVGPLLNSTQGQVLDMKDKNIQEIINKFNKEHPKDNDNNITSPPAGTILDSPIPKSPSSNNQPPPPNIGFIRPDDINKRKYFDSPIFETIS